MEGKEVFEAHQRSKVLREYLVPRANELKGKVNVIMTLVQKHAPSQWYFFVGVGSALTDEMTACRLPHTFIVLPDLDAATKLPSHALLLIHI